MYNFELLGRPIIQTPMDMIAIQELIWEIRPDLIIETGIAHGGSLIMNASMLAILDICEAIDLKKKINPRKSNENQINPINHRFPKILAPHPRPSPAARG